MVVGLRYAFVSGLYKKKKSVYGKSQLINASSTQYSCNQNSVHFGTFFYFHREARRLLQRRDVATVGWNKCDRLDGLDFFLVASRYFIDNQLA